MNLDSGLFRVIGQRTLPAVMSREKTGMTFVEIIGNETCIPLTFAQIRGSFPSCTLVITHKYLPKNHATCHKDSIES